MPKINEINNKINWVYKIGFFIILALPILIMPPYFFPQIGEKLLYLEAFWRLFCFCFSVPIFITKKNELHSKF